MQIRNKTIQIPKIQNVSHETGVVMYADDVLMVSKASISSFCAIKDMLEQFEKFAGMKVNKDKSVIFLEKIIDCTVEELRNILHWPIGSLPADYLGVPFFCGRLIEDMCCPLISKMESKLAGWKARILSFAGRIILIKYVLSTLPHYWMMVFRLPGRINKKLENICKRFLWNDGESTRHIHHISWDRLCNPYDLGGIGLPNMEDLNRALLASRCIRLLMDDGIWDKVYKDKYLQKNSLWTLNGPIRGSWGWKGLIWGWRFIQDKTEWKLGDGNRCRFWLDPWQGRPLIQRISGESSVNIVRELNILVNNKVLLSRGDTNGFEALWIDLIGNIDFIPLSNETDQES
ncbi:putative ribonuclease H protein [Nymphaea thermarum]|nr:putative ribonuclease H protein [Nymphaea thermarum]